MKLVLPFFCVIISIVVFLILLLLFLTIRINVKEVKISNVEDGIKKAKIQKTYNIFLELLIFGKIKIAKIKLNKNTLKKLKIKQKLENEKKDAENIKQDLKIIKNIRTLEILKKLKIKVDSFDLYGEIGTENAMITAFIVSVISSILRYITYKNRL